MHDNTNQNWTWVPGSGERTQELSKQELDEVRAIRAGLPPDTPCPAPFDYCEECCSPGCPGAAGEKCDQFGMSA